MFKLENKTLTVGIPFEHNGIQYPANWLQLSTAVERTTLGIVEIEMQPRPDADDRYHFIIQNDDGSWTVIPRPAEQVAETVLRSLTDGIQQRLDEFARTRNYDGILSACTYATSTVPKFAAEGQYCVVARDATWAKAYQILAEVEQGQRTMPASIADIEADLPVLTWPA